MFREIPMADVRGFLRRHSLWAGFVGALLPVGILLSLQFVWLSRLERMSTMAQQAAMQNYLEGVGSQIQYAYRSAAERALNLPPSILLQGNLEEVAWAWAKKPVPAARRLFLMDYTRDAFGNLYLFDPASGKLFPAPAEDESLAIIVACTPWQMVSYRKLPSPTLGLTVDERDADNRILLNPITDDASTVLGVVGMILDQRYFETELLPQVVQEAIPKFFQESGRRDLGVTVRDGRGRVVLGASDGGSAEDRVVRRLPFVFTDWTVELRREGEASRTWARATFAFNMTLAVLLVLLLLGGVTLALRSANRAVRLSEMKSDFVSNVSHELRTPLASIRVFAELLRLGRPPTMEKAREYGEYIDAESRRLSRLIDNILDFARIESGRKTYRFAPTDLAEVVSAVVRTFQVRLSPQGFEVGLEVPPEPIPSVALDADAMGQALHNLLDNAVKYSGDARRIDVRVAREDGEAVIAVRDGGIGIPRSEQRKVFDRFHRVSTGLVHDVKGSGLGLAIVAHIVQAHGGRVTLVSAPGHGSTFAIRLPLGATMAPSGAP
jgi:signal transduction histidine kinase